MSALRLELSHTLFQIKSVLLGGAMELSVLMASPIIHATRKVGQAYYSWSALPGIKLPLHEWDWGVGREFQTS